MSRYEITQFKQPPDEELLCGICQNVLDEPKESPCRHVFCNVCISRALETKSKCPICRKNVRKGKLKDVLPLVQNLLNKLVMECEHIGNGCKASVFLESYLSHIAKCDYKIVNCMNFPCGKQMLNKEKIQHEKNDCLFRKIVCKKCECNIVHTRIDDHDCLHTLLQSKREWKCQAESQQQKITELEKTIAELNKKASLKHYTSSLSDVGSLGSSDDDISLSSLSNISTYSHAASQSSDHNNSLPQERLSLSPVRNTRDVREILGRVIAEFAPQSTTPGSSLVTSITFSTGSTTATTITTSSSVTAPSQTRHTPYSGLDARGLSGNVSSGLSQRLESSARSSGSNIDDSALDLSVNNGIVSIPTSSHSLRSTPQHPVATVSSYSRIMRVPRSGTRNRMPESTNTGDNSSAVSSYSRIMRVQRSGTRNRMPESTNTGDNSSAGATRRSNRLRNIPANPVADFDSDLLSIPPPTSYLLDMYANGDSESSGDQSWGSIV